LVFDQTIPKFGKDRGIEARIGEFQSEYILPIDDSAGKFCSDK
jgi:hypothetical protein